MKFLFFFHVYAKNTKLRHQKQNGGGELDGKRKQEGQFFKRMIRTSRLGRRNVADIE